jgi:uncharacterized protein YecT (DUF1311 family)
MPAQATSFAPRAPLAASTSLLLAALLLASQPGGAAPYPNVEGATRDLKRSDWYQQCLRVGALRPPAKDLPPTRRAERCDAGELYYDTRYLPSPSDQDWQKVRECAFQSGDTGVLAMLYANGAGVAANPNLATRYVCSVASPLAEMKGRVANLRRKAAGSGGRFDLCEDVTSGERQGLCASVRERQREKQRSTQLAAATSLWQPKQQLGFDIVNKALRYFAQSRFEHETDLSGSVKRTMQVDALAAELDQFVIDISDFESGKIPQFSEAEYLSLDEQLQQTYQQFMQARPAAASYLGTIRKTGVEKTQSAWLAYRDAMELFGALKYPSAQSAGWKALVTSRRLKQLTELDNAAAGR